MAMSVVYTNFGGMLVGENRGGIERKYVSDTLGCLIGVLDTSGNEVYSAEYWPYGEIQTETGTNPSNWSFVGLLGYLKDLASLLYVRARHYLASAARWLTSDPIWPHEPAYGYARSLPNVLNDPMGLFPPVLLACAAACGVCIACVVGWCSDCGADIGCWIDCINNFMEGASLAVKLLCGVACVGCALCLAALLRGGGSSGSGGGSGGGTIGGGGGTIGRGGGGGGSIGRGGGGGSSTGRGGGGSGRGRPCGRRNPGFPPGRWYQNCRAAYAACIIYGNSRPPWHAWYSAKCLFCYRECKREGMTRWLHNNCDFWNWW